MNGSRSLGCSGKSDFVRMTAVMLALMSVFAASYLISSAVLPGEERNDLDFALTSTSVDASPGSVFTIHPMYGIDPGYEGIEWSSSDDSIATVEKGVVTVSDGASGTVTITAELDSDLPPVSGTSLSTVREGSAECRIAVGEPRDGTGIYNLCSENMDYATINLDPNDAFSKGLLALQFNTDGNMVITLAGYDPSWESSVQKFTGNAVSDWGKIGISVRNPHGDTFTYAYTNLQQKIGPYPPFPWFLGKDNRIEESYNCTMTCIPADQVFYGNYHVTVLFYRDYSSTVSKRIDADFTYSPGDGTVDATGTVSRQYCWIYSAQGKTKNFDMTCSFQYSEYLSYQARNTNDFSFLSGSENYVNYSSYEDVKNFMTDGGLVSRISSMLEQKYLDAGFVMGSDRSADTDYANYLLTFVQVCFTYIYDPYQYSQLSESMVSVTDYWAYPAETVYSGCGDCEDTSILAAELFVLSGYSAGVTLLPGHAMASVALKGYSPGTDADYGIRKVSEDIGGKRLDFYGCETTVENRVNAGLAWRSVSIDGMEYDFTTENWKDAAVSTYVLHGGGWYTLK